MSAEAGPAAGDRTARNWIARHPAPLVLCGYLVAAVALNWRLWAGLGTMSALGDPGLADNDLMAWFTRYAADAVARGHLPALVTAGLNAPRGIPLMWNNSVLFPAVTLAPVTLLAGPLASLTVLATLGYAGSAAAMYWLLRRHGASVLAGGLGGAVFGFSPGLLNAGVGHYGMQFAVLAPLMIEAVASIITGRGRALATGAWLGVLAAAQLFTGEEMLTDVAVASLVLLLVLAASRPSELRARLAGTAAGLATGAAVALLLCAHALWAQFRGPLAEHGTPWKIADHGNSLGAFVNPQAQLVFHTASSAAYAASHLAGSSEYLAYLGPPLLILVAAVTVWYWRDLRVRSAGVVWLVLEALSLGVNGPLLPRPVAAIPGARVPAGWDAVFARLHLPPGADVLVVPLPYSLQGEAMLWQADTGQPAELVAGWFLGPDLSGNAYDAFWGPPFTARTAHCVDAIWQGVNATTGCAEALRPALSYWHPAAVVADTGPGTPLGRFLIRILGQPAVRDGQLLAWRTG